MLVAVEVIERRLKQLRLPSKMIEEHVQQIQQWRRKHPKKHKLRLRLKEGSRPDLHWKVRK
jgi:hypothetical protein